MNTLAGCSGGRAAEANPSSAITATVPVTIHWKRWSHVQNSDFLTDFFVYFVDLQQPQRVCLPRAAAPLLWRRATAVPRVVNMNIGKTIHKDSARSMAPGRCFRAIHRRPPVAALVSCRRARRADDLTIARRRPGVKVLAEGFNQTLTLPVEFGLSRSNPVQRFAERTGRNRAEYSASERLNILGPVRGAWVRFPLPAPSLAAGSCWRHGWLSGARPSRRALGLRARFPRPSRHSTLACGGASASVRGPA